MRRFPALVAILALAVAGCGGSLAEQGAELAKDIGCLTCHTDENNVLAPTFHGIWESDVLLADGSTVVADRAYVRLSIVNPPADVVAGWDPNMPFFPLDESEVDALIAYVESLG